METMKVLLRAGASLTDPVEYNNFCDAGGGMGCGTVNTLNVLQVLEGRVDEKGDRLFSEEEVAELVAVQSAGME